MKYWTDAITITSGCKKVSPACLNCWAETNHNRFMRRANKKYDHDFSEVRMHPENLDVIKYTGKGKVFSVWNDAFHPAVPFDVVDDLLMKVWDTWQHKVLICTKRPERMAEFVAAYNDKIYYRYPMNQIYLGTTVESPDYLWRVTELLKCKPFKLFLSVESMLSSIKIPQNQLKQIDCVIAGCESGHHARETKIEWIDDLRAQCLDVGTPLWIKQLKINGKIKYDHPLSTIKREDLWRMNA